MNLFSRRRRLSWKGAGAIVVLLLVPAAAGALGLQLLQSPPAANVSIVNALVSAEGTTDATGGASGPFFQYFLPAQELFGPVFASQAIEVDLPEAGITPGGTFTLGVPVPGPGGIELVLSYFQPGSKGISTWTIFLPSSSLTSTANWRD